MPFEYLTKLSLISTGHMIDTTIRILDPQTFDFCMSGIQIPTVL